MHRLSQNRERKIAELIFDKFRVAHCKVNEIVPMRAIRFGLLDRLNPKEVELFPTVCNGLIALRYIDYLPDGLESLRLTQKGYDYIYEEELNNEMKNVPWIIPACEEKQDWDIAYNKMWKIIGAQKDNPYYVEGIVLYDLIKGFCENLPPTYAQYIEIKKTEPIDAATSATNFKTLLDNLSWGKRYDVFVKVQVIIENTVFTNDTQNTLEEDLSDEIKVEDLEKKETHPVVAISYSWDSDSHKEWVRNLADELIKNGVDVILDQYEKKGSNLDSFMEDAMRKSERVICIMTPNYKNKTENFEGGVGEEYSILRGDLYKNLKSCKYIPVLRSGSIDDSAPSALCRRNYVSLKDEDDFKAGFEELLRDIFNKPKFQKPKLGPIPTFDE